MEKAKKKTRIVKSSLELEELKMEKDNENTNTNANSNDKDDGDGTLCVNSMRQSFFNHQQDLINQQEDQNTLLI